MHVFYAKDNSFSTKHENIHPRKVFLSQMHCIRHVPWHKFPQPSFVYKLGDYICICMCVGRRAHTWKFIYNSSISLDTVCVSLLTWRPYAEYIYVLYEDMTKISIIFLAAHVSIVIVCIYMWKRAKSKIMTVSW